MKSLLLVLIIMLVGSSFVSPVQTTVSTISTGAGYSQGTVSIFSLFPLLMGRHKGYAHLRSNSHAKSSLIKLGSAVMNQSVA